MAEPKPLSAPFVSANMRLRAQMAELVDAPASGAGVLYGRGGSRPLLASFDFLIEFMSALRQWRQELFR